MCKNRKPYLRILLGLGFSFLYFVGAAQTDLRSRTGIKLKTEPVKDIEFVMNIQQRFDNKLSTFDKFILEPGIAYDLSKSFKTGAEYRFSISQNQRHIRESRHRFSGFIRYKKEIDDFDLRVKTVLQYGFDDESSAFLDYRNKLYSRNSVSLSYNIFGSKLTPKAEYEFFYHINNPNGGIINAWRITTSVDYELSKNKTLAFYYMYDKEFNVASPVNANIFGVELEIELF
jgi:hypothetical protein